MCNHCPSDFPKHKTEDNFIGEVVSGLLLIVITMFVGIMIFCGIALLAQKLGLA